MLAERPDPPCPGSTRWLNEQKAGRICARPHYGWDVPEDNRNSSDMPKLQCVRCTRRSGDVERAHMFLCDACADIHQANAFREAKALYVGVGDHGRCEYCDALCTIRYRQWLLCGYCARVVQSYRMGRLSAAYAIEKLRRVVQPQVPTLEFAEADPIEIQATARRGRPRVLATRLDLEVVHADSRVRAAWIELKTGPGAINEISEFQLDCSDCDDIENVVRTSGVPAILMHCQIAKSPEPPTMRLTGLDLWWTDLHSFAKAHTGVKPRRGNERKLAAYFATNCFRPIDGLGPHIASMLRMSSLPPAPATNCPALYDRSRR